MTIIAVRPVRATDRLVDADTLTSFPVVRPPDPADLARQARALLDGGTSVGDTAHLLNVSETEVIELSLDDICREGGWTAGIGMRPEPTGVGPCTVSWCGGGCGTAVAGERYHALTFLTVKAAGEDGGERWARVDLEASEAPRLGGVERAEIYMPVGGPGGTTEELRLTPAQAVMLGTALVEAGRAAGAKVPE